jgi:hypothetical protein
MLCSPVVGLSGCTESETQTPGLWGIEVASTATEPVSIHLTVEKTGTERYTEQFTLQHEEAITVTREWMKEPVNYNITLETDNSESTTLSTKNLEFNSTQCADVIFQIEDNGTIPTFVNNKDCALDDK